MINTFLAALRGASSRISLAVPIVIASCPDIMVSLIKHHAMKSLSDTIACLSPSFAENVFSQPGPLQTILVGSLKSDGCRLCLNPQLLHRTYACPPVETICCSVFCNIVTPRRRSQEPESRRGRRPATVPASTFIISLRLFAG